MASGNQMCKPICADLPKAPQKSNNAITVNLSKSKEKNVNTVSTTNGTREKTTR